MCRRAGRWRRRPDCRIGADEFEHLVWGTGDPDVAGLVDRDGVGYAGDDPPAEAVGRRQASPQPMRLPTSVSIPRRSIAETAGPKCEVGSHSMPCASRLR